MERHPGLVEEPVRQKQDGLNGEKELPDPSRLEDRILGTWLLRYRLLRRQEGRGRHLAHKELE